MEWDWENNDMSLYLDIFSVIIDIRRGAEYPSNVRNKNFLNFVVFEKKANLRATILSIRMCSTELLFCKNQRGSTCYPKMLYKWDSTTDIFLWIFKFFSDKLFHKTAPYHWLWKAFICLECQIIIVFVGLCKDICPNVIGEIATVLKAV